MKSFLIKCRVEDLKKNTIDALREQLHESIKTKGTLDKETIKISQELDKLLVAEMRDQKACLKC